MKIKKLAKYQDEDLLELYRQSLDQKYIAEIWNRYSRLVYGLCLNMLKSKEDSLDAVNCIFETVIKKIITTNVFFFKSWIYTISKNHCLMILRKQQRRISIFADYKAENKNEQIEYITKTNETENEGLKQAMSKLPEQQQICIQLFYYQDQSYQDISKNTGIATKQVKSHLQNGRRNLRIALKNMSYENK
jgi:RNA polymerase sigma-70 factor (ECF subfamily)